MKSNKTKTKLTKFLDKFVLDNQSTLADEEFWPLNPSQILAYFDIDFLLDFYARLKKFQAAKLSPKKVLKFLDNRALTLPAFLINYACIGFKAAHKLNLLKTSFREREEFFNYIFELIELEIPTFFENKHALKKINEKKINRIAKRDFLEITDENRATINKFKIALFGLNWSYYYDLFADCGNNSHGPYKISCRGEKLMMIIDEYSNQKPSLIWPKAKANPLTKVTVYNLYDPFDYQFNLFGRAKTTENLGQKLKFVLIKIDGKIIRRPKKLADLTSQILELSTAQYNFVEKLTDLQKVQKAIEFNYYTYRHFFGADWKIHYLQATKNIQRFGNRFIKKYKQSLSKSKNSAAKRRKLFDPRNNVL
jgi:hypothetical protein